MVRYCLVESFRIYSPSEQVADHLRRELLRGVWTIEIPGTPQLSRELGVDRKTIIAALGILESEGLLVSQGPGKRRKVLSPEKFEAPSLRIGILLYEQADRRLDYIVDLQHQLSVAGHQVQIAGKTLTELGMEPERVKHLVQKTDRSAWIVVAGSREVLQGFASESIPAFALFGRIGRVPLASTGPAKQSALAAAIERLVSFEHRRIVMLVREERRKPQPGFLERAFLKELVDRGIPAGGYNLPEWSNSMAEYHRCLDSLFDLTPPTALIIDEAPLLVSAQQYLAQKGVLSPQNVSLVCLDPDPTFAWCKPSIAHVRWPKEPIIRRIVRWSANVARGKEDVRKTSTIAEFVDGETIGPASGS